MAGQKKSSKNPKGICFCCGEKIKNRVRSAKYCDKHSSIKKAIHKEVFNIIRIIERKYQDYNIKTRLNLKITKKNAKE